MGCSTSSATHIQQTIPSSPKVDGSSQNQCGSPEADGSPKAESEIVEFYGKPVTPDSSCSPCLQMCSKGCGRPAFGLHDTCCTRCRGPGSTHSSDCESKGLCSGGCGRRAYVGADGKVFKTCCKSCSYLHQEKGVCGHDIGCDVRHSAGTCPPWYWKSATMWPNDFQQTIGGDYVRKMATKLLQKSLPSHEVVQCTRTENSKLWAAYAGIRAKIRERVVTIEDIKPETSEMIEFSANTTLDHLVNEVWLFHGTSEDAAKTIVNDNFRIPCHAGNFGKGAYFADASRKSDGYARQTVETSEFCGCKVMMLCRVILGNVYHVQGTDRQAERLVRDPNFDSVVGKTDFREFLVYDTAQIYPEYVLYYKKSG